MKFTVRGDDELVSILKADAPAAEWIHITDANQLTTQTNVDAYFDLRSEASATEYSFTHLPVFINSVTTTLSEKKYPENVVRINGWAGFAKKNIWEIAGKMSEPAAKAMGAIGKKFITVPDVPGFVTARVIAMIINEAFFAKGENISSEAEIDLAMKLGTNYPYGPFEWAKLIGVKNVFELLSKLAQTDKRYTPAPALQSEMKQAS